MNLLTKIKTTYWGYGLRSNMSDDNVITLKKGDTYPYTFTIKADGKLTTVIIDRKGANKPIENVGFNTQTEAIEFIKDFLKKNDDQAEKESLSYIEDKRNEQKKRDDMKLRKSVNNIRNKGNEDSVKVAEVCLQAYENKGYLSINENIYVSSAYEQLDKEALPSKGGMLCELCGFTFTLYNTVNINVNLETFEAVGGDVIKYGSWYEIDSDMANEYLKEILEQI